MDLRTRSSAASSRRADADSAADAGRTSSSRVDDTRRSSSHHSRAGRDCSKPWFCCLLLAMVIMLLVVYTVCISLFSDFQLDPIDASLPDAPPLTGALSPNFAESIADAELLFADVLNGAECLEWDEMGTLYTGTVNGEIWQLSSGQGQKPSLVASTGSIMCVPDSTLERPKRECGRPLGVRVTSHDSLLVADGFGGLLNVSLSDGTVRVLIRNEKSELVSGKPLLLANDLVVAPDGMVYITDSSSKFGNDKLLYDLVEGAPNGRVVRYDPVTGVANTFVDKLHFPNGIELSQDGQSILVVETTKARVIRIFISGERTGQSEVMLPATPGFPDNIRRHPNGGYLIGMSGARTALVTFLENKPWIRKFLVSIMPYKVLLSLSKPYSLCVHVSE
eukprot:scpid79428/ scgid3504/ Adipocyte plasma membrane-associated protein